MKTRRWFQVGSFLLIAKMIPTQKAGPVVSSGAAGGCGYSDTAQPLAPLFRDRQIFSKHYIPTDHCSLQGFLGPLSRRRLLLQQPNWLEKAPTKAIGAAV